MKSMIPGYKTFKAIKFLITGPMILAMLFVIQMMTPGGTHWFRWALFGIGLAWMISLMRVLRSVIVVGGLAALAFIAYKYFTKQQVTIPAQLV
jgi:hypothetical protein